MNFGGKIFLIATLFLFSLTVLAKDVNEFSFSAQNFKNDQSFALNKPIWKYHPGADSNWVNFGFDDSEWRFLDRSKLNAENLGKDCDDIYWFGTHLNVDE